MNAMIQLNTPGIARLAFALPIWGALMVATALADGLGIPSRDPQLDVMPGFKEPPPGYGEVPYWWWTGENLNVDRMISQLR